MIIDNARIENMDCLEFLKTIPDNSVTLFLVDEPYMLLKGHKIEEGYNLDIALQVRTEAMRVLKKDGWFVFFGQFPSAYHFYTKTLEAGFEPWQQCNEIVWCKRSVSSPFGKIGRIHENIFVFTKGNPQTYNNHVPFEDIIVDNAFHGICSFENIKRRLSEMAKYYRTGKKLLYKEKTCNIYDGQYERISPTVGNTTFNSDLKISSIWSFYLDGKKQRLSQKARLDGKTKDVIKNGSAHVTQKPTLLIARIIKLFTTDGDTILDCFLGSGTTAIATLQCQNRHFVGCERDKTYFDIAVDRCQNWREDLDKQNEWLEERGVMPFNVNDNNKQINLF